MYTPTNVYIQDNASDTKGTPAACVRTLFVCTCVRVRGYARVRCILNSPRTNSRLLRWNVLPSGDALHTSAQQYKRLLLSLSSPYLRLS